MHLKRTRSEKLHTREVTTEFVLRDKYGTVKPLWNETRLGKYLRTLPGSCLEAGTASPHSRRSTSSRARGAPTCDTATCEKPFSSTAAVDSCWRATGAASQILLLRAAEAPVRKRSCSPEALTSVLCSTPWRSQLPSLSHLSRVVWLIPSSRPKHDLTASCDRGM